VKGLISPKFELGDRETLLKTYDAAEWNPVLIAVAKGHLPIVKYFFE
jgi:hypothetical protein